MASLSYPSAEQTLAGATASAQRPVIYSGARHVSLASGPGHDYRLPAGIDDSGTITANNRVMLKPEPTAPEVPFAGARVRLHRLLDGACSWQGLSDANGYYWPRGLEVGLWYYPVAIDLTGTHECDAAGPVLAVREGS